MSQSLPDATSDDSLAVEEFLLATEGSHDLNLGLDQISIADTIAPTENIFAKIGKGANARGVFPAHKLAMEDIYPDADLKLQDEDEGVQVHSDESHVAPAVYLMDIFVSLPPSVWKGTTRYLNNFHLIKGPMVLIIIINIIYHPPATRTFHPKQT